MVLMYQDITSSMVKTKELIPLLIQLLIQDLMPSTCTLTAPSKGTPAVSLMIQAAPNTLITMPSSMSVMTWTKVTGWSVTPGPHPGERLVTSRWRWAATSVTLNTTPGFHSFKTKIWSTFQNYETINCYRWYFKHMPALFD